MMGGIRPDYPFRCDDCGIAHYLDCVVPSPVWNAIARDGVRDADMLCAMCIDKRMQALGLEAECEFYFNGTALKSRLYGMSDPAGDDVLSRMILIAFVLVFGLGILLGKLG